jgi:RNA polymerase sigma-70 factor (ECF subfamily)
MNTARDMQRSAWNRRVKSMALEELPLAARESPHNLRLEDQETILRLRQAILQLREEEQEVFLLRQNGELTYEEIAEIRQAPVGTVKTQMRAALQKLRRILNPDES